VRLFSKIEQTRKPEWMAQEVWVKTYAGQMEELRKALSELWETIKREFRKCLT